MLHVPIEERALRNAHFAWIEERLFEILGEWAGAGADPEVKLLLRSQSFHHADHARSWRALVPRLAHVPGAGLTASPAERHATILEPLERWAGACGFDDQALATLYRSVMPALVALYERELELTSPVADAPTRAWLARVVAEERLHLADGQALVTPPPA